MNFFDILFNQKFNGHKGSLVDQLFAAATKVYTTAKAAIVSFYTTRVAPLVALLAYIEPIQDLHGQSSPYPAGGGKNKIDDSQNNLPYSAQGITISKSETTYTIVVDSATGYPFVTVGKVYGLKAGTYTLSGIKSTGLTSSNSSIRIANRTVTPAVTYSGTFTLDADVTSELLVELAFTGASLTDGTYTIKDVQLEVGSTATSYSPYSNICPISGTTEVVVVRGGINQWDEEWEVGGIDDDTGLPLGENNRIRSKNFDACVPNTTYYGIDPTNGLNMRVYWYDANKTYISRTNWVGNNTFTSPSNARYFKLKMGFAYGTTYNHDISINYPSTDHDYHSFISPLTITTELGQTVYGGTLDVVSGVLTVDRAMVEFENLDWSYWQQSATQNTFYVNISDKAFGTTNLQTSIYAVLAQGGFGQLGNGQIVGRTDNSYVYLVDNRFTDVASFKTAITGQQLVYSLATPITIQLTPQEVTSLLGDNTVWADSGNVEVTYKGGA